MTDIRFYHLKTMTADQALPQILGKATQGGRHVVVKVGNAAMLERLNEYLWTYRPDSFLPHGTDKDGFAEKQPVFLTAGDDNPNQADILILTDGAVANDVSAFAMCCEMLDERFPDHIAAARERWKQYQDDGHSVTYWQQTPTGGWEQKS